MIAEGELGLTGKGVAPVQIKEIDDLVDNYIAARDERIVSSANESEAKEKLIDAMHGYAKQLETSDGDLVYHSRGITVSLIAGNEKLKVEEPKP